MARPAKTGLDYFPLDTDMDQDDKIYMLEAELGEIAFGRLVKLLMTIYREGYYKKWGESEILVFAGKKNIPVDELKILVLSALTRSLFDLNQYQLYGILTSAGIQKRYIKACENRNQIILQEEYLLIDLDNFSDKIKSRIKYVKTDIMPIKSNITAIKPAPSTQKKREEKIIKEKKKENNINIPPDPEKEEELIIPGYEDPPAKKNKKPSPKKNPKKSELWHRIQKVFTDKHPNQFAFKRENPHIDRFCEISEAQQEPEEFAFEYLNVFWKMTENGKDKCVCGQPYLPSILMSGGIWPRIEKQVRRGLESLDPETLAAAKSLFPGAKHDTQISD